jgi:hypothetical protein
LNYGQVLLSPERRRWLLREAISQAQAGDLLFFYHRTSWRSRWIRRITACELPHVCVYLGGGRIVGMLRGRVRRHFLRRFVRDEYELRFVRGSADIARRALEFLGQREAWLDLAVLGACVLLERAVGLGVARRLLPYRMRGVTCSGVVSSAWHATTGVVPSCEPIKHTPLDLERAVGKASFLAASLLPAAADAASAPARELAGTGRGRDYPLDVE